MKMSEATEGAIVRNISTGRIFLRVGGRGYICFSDQPLTWTVRDPKSQSPDPEVVELTTAEKLNDALKNITVQDESSADFVSEFPAGTIYRIFCPNGRHHAMRVGQRHFVRLYVDYVDSYNTRPIHKLQPIDGMMLGIPVTTCMELSKHL